MTAPRQVLPDTIYLITRRCSDRRFFLKPLPIVNQVFGYLVGVVAARFDVQVHAACVLSNHYHLVLTDTNATLPRFVQQLNGTLARFLNKLHGRKENVFPSGSYSAVELADEGAVMEACAYTLANPVVAGLVARASEWPGLWSAPGEIGGSPRVYERPPLFFDRKGGMPTAASLAFTVPRGFEPDAFRKGLAAELEARERDAAELMKAEEKEWLGVARIMAQSPEERATGEEKPQGRKNHVSAVNVWSWLFTAARRHLFRKEYGNALHAYRAGKRSTCFPSGTFLLRVHLGVVCAAAG